MWIYEHEASQYQCHRGEAEIFGPCQGRRCMAWRWGYINKIDDPSYTGQSFGPLDIGVPENKFPPNTRFRGRKGYCGLAGKPAE